MSSVFNPKTTPEGLVFSRYEDISDSSNTIGKFRERELQFWDHISYSL